MVAAAADAAAAAAACWHGRLGGGVDADADGVVGPRRRQARLTHARLAPDAVAVSAVTLAGDRFELTAAELAAELTIRGDLTRSEVDLKALLCARYPLELFDAEFTLSPVDDDWPRCHCHPAAAAAVAGTTAADDGGNRSPPADPAAEPKEPGADAQRADWEPGWLDWGAARAERGGQSGSSPADPNPAGSGTSGSVVIGGGPRFPVIGPETAVELLAGSLPPLETFICFAELTPVLIDVSDVAADPAPVPLELALDCGTAGYAKAKVGALVGRSPGNFELVLDGADIAPGVGGMNTRLTSLRLKATSTLVVFAWP